MNRRGALAVATFALAAILPVAAAQPCFAIGDGPDQASLLIDDGQTERRYCLNFEGPISGLDALKMTGLELRLEDFGGRVAVCSIDGVGCATPEQDCFCRFEGESIFWGAYRLGAQGWVFSELGASDLSVTNGIVDAWRFAAHTPEGGNPPVADVGALPCARPVAKPKRDVSVGTPLLATLGLILAIAAMILASRWFRRRLLEDT
ncbi:MAG: hypothetical protein ACLGH3_05145 [Actinomycetota bacterium]